MFTRVLTTDFGLLCVSNNLAVINTTPVDMVWMELNKSSISQRVADLGAYMFLSSNKNSNKLKPANRPRFLPLNDVCYFVRTQKKLH